MNNKSKKILITIFIIIIGGFLITSVAIMLNPAFNGIIVDRITEGDIKTLIYSDINLSIIQALTIVALIISVFLLISLLIQFIGNEKLSITNKRLIASVNLSLSTFIILFNVVVLVIYPIAFDKYNYYSWALGLANIILIISLIIYIIYEWLIKKEVAVVKHQNHIQILTEGAISVAIAVILSVFSDLIPFLKLPNGGSFSLSMLPIFIFALRRGGKAGFLMGLTYSIINFLIDGMIIHWGSIFFDYLIPYSLLGLISGLFSKKANQGKISFVIISVLLGGFIRYLSHSFSGVIFFSMYAPEGLTAFFYSFVVYNLPYMTVSTFGSLIFVLLLYRQLIKEDSKVV